MHRGPSPCLKCPWDLIRNYHIGTINHRQSDFNIGVYIRGVYFIEGYFLPNIKCFFHWICRVYLLAYIFSISFKQVFCMANLGYGWNQFLSNGFIRYICSETIGKLTVLLITCDFFCKKRVFGSFWNRLFYDSAKCCLSFFFVLADHVWFFYWFFNPGLLSCIWSKMASP